MWKSDQETSEEINSYLKIAPRFKSLESNTHVNLEYCEWYCVNELVLQYLYTAHFLHKSSLISSISGAGEITSAAF